MLNSLIYVHCFQFSFHVRANFIEGGKNSENSRKGELVLVRPHNFQHSKGICETVDASRAV